MAKLRPFKAIRPVRDKAHLVAALPHYAYKRNVLKAILEVNPYIFLNIIHPEFKSKVKTAPNSTDRFRQIKDKYADFLAEGYVFQDDQPHIYLYRQTNGNNTYLGIIGAASVEEYKKDIIKKHEATLTSREALFTHYLDVVGYNAEPVLLSYSGNADTKKIKEAKITERAEYEFTTTDLCKHELWVLNESESKSMIKAFSKIEATYIADGHHRSASSAGLRNLRNKRGEKHFPNEDYFLAYFIEEHDLNILEFNRLIKTIGELSPENFLDLLKESFHIKPLKRAQKPSKEHEFSMYLLDKWYLLTCKPEIIDENHPVNSLDAEILTRYALEPILDIHDLKTDDRIDFISGNHPLREITKRIRKGDFEVGFVLFPATIEQIKSVADNQLIMPPKSTWVEPKLRSGLTIYNINE